MEPSEDVATRYTGALQTQSRAPIGTNEITNTNGHYTRNDDQRRFSVADSLDQNSISGGRSIDEDEEAYLLRISKQNSRQSSLTLDRSEGSDLRQDSGIVQPYLTPLSCQPYKFTQAGYYLKQTSETVKSSSIKLLISLPIGFPQHGQPNLTKEILSTLKTSLDGIINAETGLNSKNILVVIYVEFGWLETTIDLLTRLGALPSGHHQSKVDEKSVHAYMFEVNVFLHLVPDRSTIL